MRTIKISLLVSTILLWGVYDARGMEEDFPDQDRKTLTTTAPFPTSNTAHLKSEQEELTPLHYISQFTLPAEEASRLLSPHWKYRFKGKLARSIGVTQSTLKALIEEKKQNKALRAFNEALIEKAEIWKLFSVHEQLQIILGQLIRINHLENVAEQLQVQPDQLDLFWKSPVDSSTLEAAILANLSKVAKQNWEQGEAENQQPFARNAVKRLRATHDQKAVSGYGCVNRFRALTHIDGKDKVLYGSSDREEGHLPPDTNILSQKQQQHLVQFKAVANVFQSADPKVSQQQLTQLVSDMSIQSNPTPGMGKIYIGTAQGKKELQEHDHFSAEMKVKLFTDGTLPPNFCSQTGDSITETRAKCRPKGETYDGDRREPIKTYAYQHTLQSGHIITFDRGHGCDHADTLEHGGLLSSYDPDNFVPQNSFYNRHIRNPLVNMIRSSGGEYKEISLYHQSPLMTNDTRIPEAFVFIELYDGKAEKAYFFPNFISYEALEFEKPYKSNYLNFLDLFRVNDLIDYFYIPFVQAQNPIPHMEQRDRGTILAERIYLDIITLFNNMTEDAFPPRARSTLIKSIMNQGVDTAAILDFEGLTCLETAVNHYSNNRIYWELDDRPEEARQATFESNFSKLSSSFQRAYESTESKFSAEKNHRGFKQAIVRAFGSLVDVVETPDQEILRLIIGGRSVKNIELAKKYLKVALSKIERGDYNDRDLRGIIHILTYIHELEDYEKAKSLLPLLKEEEPRSITDEFLLYSSSLDDSEMEIQHFFTFEVLQNKLREGLREIESGNVKVSTLFEMMLILEKNSHPQIDLEEVYNLLNAMDLLASTIEEKKKIADFLWIASYYEEKEIWIKKIGAHFDREPNLRNAELLSSWLQEGNGSMQKDPDLAQEVLRIARTHALEKP